MQIRADAQRQIVLSTLEFANRSDQSTTFGLIAIGGWLRGVPICPAFLDIALGDIAVSLNGKECFLEIEPGVWRVVFHLITHLIPNGENVLKVRAKLADRTEWAFPLRAIRIDNSSPLADSVSADLKAKGVSPVVGRVIDSTLFPYGSGLSKAWFDIEPEPDVPMSLEPAVSVEAAEDHLRRWGFAVLPDLLPADLIGRFIAELEAAINDGRLPYQRGTSDRIHNAHKLPAGREIWLYPPVLDFLRQHFCDTPCACQTLTYVNGSEQDPHQDTIHLTPYPAGYMCGVWIALEDVRPDSGELFVYPGSHRTPRLLAGPLGLEKVDKDYSAYVRFSSEIYRLIEEGGYERLEYRPKAGQILIWHENLIHGGSPRRDRSRTRNSIVSHYFPRGAVAYYDSRGEAASLEEVR